MWLCHSQMQTAPSQSDRVREQRNRVLGRKPLPRPPQSMVESQLSIQIGPFPIAFRRLANERRVENQAGRGEDATAAHSTEANGWLEPFMVSWI